MLRIYFIFIMHFITVILVIASGKYRINNDVPNYLYKKFNNIKEELFPEDIQIIISLSRISGTLLYSIDKNMNQLIVTLSDEMAPTITVEFRKQEYYQSLSQLCGCERCRFEILDLRIKILSKIFLQCNNGDLKEFDYINNKAVNQRYPFKINFTETLANEGHLWLVNHQRFGELHPNSLQLLGCIFDVWYRGEPIIFNNISNNIQRKCTKRCFGNICNGGQCYETYNGGPICDCTKIFLNGKYCNDTIYPINIRSLFTEFQFDMLKLSWKSSNKEILLLKNSNLEIQLWMDEMSYLNKTLILEYKYEDKNHISLNENSTYVLSRRYIQDTEYILLIQFLETDINIKFLNNGSCLNITILTNRDLRREVFTSLTLRSGKGFIELSQKTSKQFTWRKVYIQTYEEILNMKKNIQILSKNETMIGSHYAFIVTIGVLAALVLVLVVALVVVLCLYLRNRQGIPGSINNLPHGRGSAAHSLLERPIEPASDLMLQTEPSLTETLIDPTRDSVLQSSHERRSATLSSSYGVNKDSLLYADDPV